MVVEAPTRNIAFSFSGREKSVNLEQTRGAGRGFWEYGSVAGRPESSVGYWVPIDWMAWKLLTEVLGIPPEKLK
ncbi:MAG: hypothetical protein NTZ07_00880 [Candidatus Woesebacteria bacterium]|nr:hypothetical protein [Candidatus Woesebacteria bacterium]